MGSRVPARLSISDLPIPDASIADVSIADWPIAEWPVADLPAPPSSTRSSPRLLFLIAKALRRPAAAVRSSLAGCLGIAALAVLFANRGLEPAAANGDTRTLTLHHVHTDETIQVTYKLNGRYDEDALRRLDHFLRDWRREEDVHMDPRLFDVVWEVSREVGPERTVQVLCGYRAPETNAMLRRRSGGVAEFSQHTLGKAMDFYVPGASLEETRAAGLRLQRGGVGYYPTSGSPFVHMDVGNVRHWPRMSREQLVRVFPDGRTVHIPTDGQPLPGYALAFADIQRRGSSPPSATSLAAAQSAGIDTSAVPGGRQKNLIAALLHLEEEDDDTAANAAPPRTFSLASLPPDGRSPDGRSPDARTSDPRSSDPRSSDSRSSDARISGRTAIPVPTPRPPQRPPAAAAVAAAGGADLPGRQGPHDADRVPREAMAYADLPRSGDDGADFESRFDAARDVIRLIAAGDSSPAGGGLRSTALRSVPGDDGAPARKAAAPSRAAGMPPVVHVKAAAAAVAGMRYDDPWLRAAILAPPLYGAMTATPCGDPDLTGLGALILKPARIVTMSFAKEPYPGMTALRFSGDAVVFPASGAFHRTASRD